MNALLIVITLLTRTLVRVLRLFGKGGTSLPGLWVELYAPWLITAYARSFPTIILITGTNGKTTTQLTVSTALKEAGYDVVHNSSGANMLRGLAATLLTHGPVGNQKSLLLLETEEATMPKLTSLIEATHIIVTNLYRDQLDAYGELHTTAHYIMKACHNNPKAHVILNHDDGSLETIRSNIENPMISFSLGTYTDQFLYESRSSHKEKPAVKATQITIQPDFSSKVTVEDAIGSTNHHVELAYQPPGMYNVYNLIASYSLLRLLQISSQKAAALLAHVSPPFGRGEVIKIDYKGKKRIFHLFLVKNPAGFSQVWRMIQSIPQKKMIVALNDNIADGRDVSWIWDIDIEGVYDRKKPIHHLIFSGQRAGDMALRFKYAEVKASHTTIQPEISVNIDSVIEDSMAEAQWIILCTYTALNEFRRSAARYTNIKAFQ